MTVGPDSLGVSVLPIRTARLPVPEIATTGDSTGCGDVCGATLPRRLLRGGALGDAAFRSLAARALGRRLTPGRAGRPPKRKSGTERDPILSESAR